MSIELNIPDEGLALPAPAQAPPTVVTAIGEALSSRVALVADIIGAIGFFGLAWTILNWVADAQGRLLGVGVVWWTILSGTIVFSLVLILSLYQLVGLTRRHADSISAKLVESENQLRASRQHPTRDMQKRATEAMSDLYGYYLPLVEHEFNISKDGSAVTKHIQHFMAGRRSIGQWARIKGSSQVENLKAVDDPKFLTEGFAVSSVSSSRLSPHRTLEEFVFSRSIQRSHGVVPLVINDSYSAGAFLVGSPNTANRDFDYVSVSVREPVCLLRIVVYLEGLDPSPVGCDAVYGPAQERLKREEVDADESLTTEIVGTRLKVTLELTYPVIGVVYKVRWALPSLPRQAAASRP